MARTSKSRGASGFKMKSGNKSSFKMMGASPVREDDEFPGLLPEVGVVEELVETTLRKIYQMPREIQMQQE